MRTHPWCYSTAGQRRGANSYKIFWDSNSVLLDSGSKDGRDLNRFVCQTYLSRTLGWNVFWARAEHFFTYSEDVFPALRALVVWWTLKQDADRRVNKEFAPRFTVCSVCSYHNASDIKEIMSYFWKYAYFDLFLNVREDHCHSLVCMWS